MLNIVPDPTPVAEPTVGHWFTDRTPDATFAGLHYAVRLSVQYARGACGDVFKPGDCDDDTAIDRCPRCVEAIARVTDTLPADVEDGPAFVLHALASALKDTGWREIEPGKFIAVSDGPTRRTWAPAGRTARARARGRLRIVNESDAPPDGEPEPDSESTTDPEPAEDAAPVSDTSQETSVSTTTAPRKSSTSKSATPKAKSKAKAKATDLVAAAHAELGNALARTTSRKAAATAAPATTTTPRPGRKPAAPPPDTQGKSPKEWRATWKKENDKLQAMPADDPKRDAQFNKVRNAARAYRAALNSKKG